MRRQVQRWTLLLLVVLESSCGYKPVLRQYYASCSQGLVPALEKELSSAPIGATRIVPGKRGCEFWGPEEMGYQALLWSRVANGVWELLQRRERVFDREDLYTMVRRMPWEQLMDVDQTLAVQCIVGESVSRDVSHSHYSSLTVKNAIIDLFRDRDPQGRRPSVDTEAPDLPLICYIHRDEVSLYRSLSGLSSMHKRGYRDAMHVASLRETLAAAMLVMADYDPETQVLCDPMCGSGTIAIEGALMARRIAPGLLRLRKSRSAASLAPAAWPDTDTTLLRQTILDARNAMRDSAPMPILANDVHRGACSLCDRDAFAAGVSEDVTLSNFDVLEFKPEVAPDLVVTNPPWDLRLTEGAGESWTALGTWLKREAAGGEAWALSGNPELTRNLFMKATRRINIEQSGIKLRLLNYEVLKPKPRPTEEEGQGAFKPRVTEEEEQDLVSE